MIQYCLHYHLRLEYRPNEGVQTYFSRKQETSIFSRYVLNFFFILAMCIAKVILPCILCISILISRFYTPHACQIKEDVLFWYSNHHLNSCKPCSAIPAVDRWTAGIAEHCKMKMQKTYWWVYTDIWVHRHTHKHTWSRSTHMHTNRHKCMQI